MPLSGRVPKELPARQCKRPRIDLAGRRFASTNTALRVRCVRQLHDGLREQLESLRQITVAEAGAPIMLTFGPQLEGPIDGLQFAADTAQSYQWHQDLGVASPMGIATQRTLASS